MMSSGSGAGPKLSTLPLSTLVITIQNRTGQDTHTHQKMFIKEGKKTKESNRKDRGRGHQMGEIAAEGGKGLDIDYVGAIGY